MGPDCLCCHAIAPVLFEWKAPLLLFSEWHSIGEEALVSLNCAFPLAT